MACISITTGRIGNSKRGWGDVCIVAPTNMYGTYARLLTDAETQIIIPLLGEGGEMYAHDYDGEREWKGSINGREVPSNVIRTIIDGLSELGWGWYHVIPEGGFAMVEQHRAFAQNENHAAHVWADNAPAEITRLETQP